MQRYQYGYISHGNVEESQIQAMIRSVAQEALKRKLVHSSSYELNYVRNSQKQAVGLSYLWVEDSALLHLLMSRNPDGTERKELVEDGTTNAQHERGYQSYKDADIFYATFEELLREMKTMTWGDIMDIEESRSKYRTLPPLVPIPSVTMNGVTQLVSVSVLKLKPLAPELDAYTLFCTRVPSWLDTTAIRNLFTRYSTSTKKGKYPSVKVTPSGTAFVSFDPITQDAQYALFMKKVVTIEQPSKGKDNRDNGAKKALLIFSHPNKTGHAPTSTKHK